MGNNISRISKEYDARYIEGKIYTITCKDGEVYVGSTIETLKARFSKHKNKNQTCSIYYYIRDNYNGDWSKCKIKLYENYPCNNEYELNRREGEITRLIGTINKCIAGRTKREWCEENREKIAEYQKEYQKEYRENNQEKIKEYNKEYYDKNKETKSEKNKQKIECECGCVIRKSDLKRHQTSQKHKDLMEKQITKNISFLESI